MPQNVTRAELRIRGVGYSLLGLAGPWAVIHPPPTLSVGWSSVYVITWGLLLVPALIASVASCIGRYRVEMIVLPWIMAGLLLQAAAMWYLVPISFTWGAMALVTSSFILMLVNRYIALMRLTRTASPSTGPITKVDPRKPHQGE